MLRVLSDKGPPWPKHVRGMFNVRLFSRNYKLLRWPLF